MIGEILGNYRLMRVLGRGGMGVVYLGQHVLIGTKVAVKVLLPEMSINQGMVNRFFNEARAAAMIDHPGICQVFDFGRYQQSAYLVMEYLQGEALSVRVRREGRLDPAVVVAVGRQIAAAVGAAHGAGIVHRDLKPDNVFLIPDPEVTAGVRVKVLDFGVAKLAGDMSASRTGSGSMLGTPTYMSPEQCRGAGEVDLRSDIYSLGCILFKMACGRRVFTGDGPGEIIAAHLREPPPRPSQFVSGLPPELEAAIVRTLAKSPAERQQTMAELAYELDYARRGAAQGAGIPQGAWAGPGSAGMIGTTTPVSSAARMQMQHAEPIAAVGSNTLGTVAGESVISPRSRHRRAWVIGGVATVLGIAGAVAIVALNSGETSAPQGPAAGPVPAAAPAPPEAVPAAPTPAATAPAPVTPPAVAPTKAVPAEAVPPEAVPSEEPPEVAPTAPAEVAPGEATPAKPEAAPATAEKAQPPPADKKRAVKPKKRRSDDTIKRGTIDPFAD